MQSASPDGDLETAVLARRVCGHNRFVCLVDGDERVHSGLARVVFRGDVDFAVDPIGAEIVHQRKEREEELEYVDFWSLLLSLLIVFFVIGCAAESRLDVRPKYRSSLLTSRA